MTETATTHSGVKKKDELNSMREMKVPLIESGADAFLEVLRSLPGVDYIFADVGTDHAPLVEALAKSKVFGKSFPKIITAPHEIVAAAMAMGYYCASGKPQLVLVHTVPGTLQAHGMVGNSFSAQIPFILVAGRTPITEFGVFGGKSIAIHWTQESRDQGSLIRDYVKWDFEHRTNVQLVDIVYRAYRVAMTEPRGPVYLIFPRETWSEKIDPNFEIPKRKNFEPPTSPQGDHAALRKIVRTLVDSETPVVVPDLLGRNPNAVQPLVDLCTLLSLPVTPTFTRMNYPTNDYHFVGQHGLGGQQGASSRYFKSADSLLFLDVAVPWVPELGRPRSDAKVMMMDLDPAVLTIPTWGFPIDLAVACDTNLAVRSMIEEGKRILEKEPETRRRLEERADKIAEDHRKFKKVLADDVERVSKDKPIDFVWLSHCIGKVKDADTIVLNEYDLRPNYVEFTKPNTLFGNPRLGCLGWGIGGAIGMKFAAPEKTVIATLGDGAYIAGVPTAGHFTANTYGVPVLFVIFNNQCWNASKSSTVYMYPDGFGAKSDDFPGVDLRPSPDYAGIAKACGAYGETVEDPGELESALSRALDATKRQKRQALLNVICKYPSV